SIVRFVPVMYAAKGEHRAVVHQPISSTEASRPAGTVASTPARASAVGQSAPPAPSVSVGPGQIVFTRMLCGAHSTASVLVMASSPAFADAERAVPRPQIQ